MSQWKSAFNKVNATNTIVRSVQKEKDEAYNPATMIPPPTGPPRYAHHPQHGSNASCYAPASTSPFNQTSNPPPQENSPFTRAPECGQNYSNSQPSYHYSSPPPPTKESYTGGDPNFQASCQYSTQQMQGNAQLGFVQPSQYQPSVTPLPQS